MDKETEQFITGHSDWHEEEGKLVGRFGLSSFDAVREVVSKIMNIAEEHDHHPEVTFGYNVVEVKTVTHDKGNTITEKDLKLAEAISNTISNK